MLKQRLLTAAVLIPLVIAGILYLPVSAIAIILGLLMLQGAWEWSRLSGLEQKPLRIAYVGLTALIFALLWWHFEKAAVHASMPIVSALFWLCAAVWVFLPALGRQITLSTTAIKLLAGLFVLVLSWFALVAVHGAPSHGPKWILYLLFLIWIADSGAYFAGRAFGRHKLAPTVSPGKTWEGVAGAALLVFLYALLAPFWLTLSDDAALTLVWVSLVLVPVSVLGDLFESLMKRQSGIKDSGQLLPGHGGVMDRIDSLTSVFPVYLSLAGTAGLL